MNETLKRICLLLFGIAVAFSCASCTSGKSDVAVVEEGKAPDFTLNDLNGSKVGLSGLRGKVVLVEFWATWCPPCRESIPELNMIHDKYKNRGVAVLGISVDKGGDVGSFVKENPVSYPVLIDDGKTNVSYGVSSIPALFLIDKNGKIVKRFAGFTPGLSENLSREIEALL